jgi:hypothetical protein
MISSAAHMVSFETNLPFRTDTFDLQFWFLSIESNNHKVLEIVVYIIGSDIEFLMHCSMKMRELINHQNVPTGENVVFVANDWHTALLPCYLKSEYKPSGQFQNAKVSDHFMHAVHVGVTLSTCDRKKRNSS